MSAGRDYLISPRTSGHDDARGGGEERYAEVAREFGAALERLAGGYERDPDARRDLLQDIHVALWRSLARYDGRCSSTSRTKTRRR